MQRTKIGNIQVFPQNFSDLERCLENICNKDVIRFGDLKTGDIPDKPGVYIITDCRNEDVHENSFYVGKSINLRQRIRSHLSGNEKTSPTIRYLVSDEVEIEVVDKIDARGFIRGNLGLRWLEFEEFELSALQGMEKSIGYVEAYLVSRFQPLYGIFNPYRKNLKSK